MLKQFSCSYGVNFHLLNNSAQPVGLHN